MATITWPVRAERWGWSPCPSQHPVLLAPGEEPRLAERQCNGSRQTRVRRHGTRNAPFTELLHDQQDSAEGKHNPLPWGAPSLKLLCIYRPGWLRRGALEPPSTHQNLVPGRHTKPSNGCPNQVPSLSPEARWAGSHNSWSRCNPRTHLSVGYRDARWGRRHGVRTQIYKSIRAGTACVQACWERRQTGWEDKISISFNICSKTNVLQPPTPVITD